LDEYKQIFIVLLHTPEFCVCAVQVETCGQFDGHIFSSPAQRIIKHVVLNWRCGWPDTRFHVIIEAMPISCQFWNV